MPTINLTSGCAHGCLYCYTRSYAAHPGEDKVILYGNIPEKLKDELAHKRTKPQAVYFSPSIKIATLRHCEERSDEAISHN